MHKKCPRCKRTLDASKFNWKIKNKKRASYCRDCSRQYIKNHYEHNRKYYIDKAKKRNKIIKQKKQEFIEDYLKKHPCIDCGETNILVLEFDHRDRENKKNDIADIVKQKLSFVKLIKEISKCEVRCANCHRIKTAKEINSWKLKHAP
ncbi:MAG: hypothetical protein ABII10_01020, partial [Candidatus Paceibacterota bacterium]